MPVARTESQKAVISLKYGESLKILATDPAAAIDFPHYCAESGNELVSQHEEAGVLVFIIRKTHAK